MGGVCWSLRLEPRPLLWELVRGGDGGAGTALIFQPLLSHCKESGAVCLATAPCFTCGSGRNGVLCALRESFWALFDVTWD